MVGVVDDDGSNWSGWLMGNITDTAALVVVPYDNADAAYADLGTGKVSAVLVIPDGFESSVGSFYSSPLNNSAWDVSTLDFGIDQGSMIAGSVVPAFIQQALMVTMYGKDALNAPSPVVIGSPVMVESIKLTQFDYMVPGMFSYAAIFTSMLVAQVFTEERQQGLLKRVAFTPTSSGEIFIGQILANIVTGVVQVLVVLGASYLMGFRPMGGLSGVLIALITTLLLVITNVGFGLIVATFAKTSGAATGIAFIFILPQMFLGSFVPAPQSVARFVPSFYVTETLNTIFLRGAPVLSGVVLKNIGILSGITFAVIWLGVFLNGRMESHN